MRRYVVGCKTSSANMIANASYGGTLPVHCLARRHPNQVLPFDQLIWRPVLVVTRVPTRFPQVVATI
jgi:hypothetical protein